MERIAFVLVVMLSFTIGFLASEYRSHILGQKSSPTVSLTAPVQTHDASEPQTKSDHITLESSSARAKAPIEEGMAALSPPGGRGKQHDTVEALIVEPEMEALPPSLNEGGVSQEEIQERFETHLMRVIEESQRLSSERLDRTDEELMEELRASLEEAGMPPEYIDRITKGFFMGEVTESQITSPEGMDHAGVAPLRR